MSKHVLIKTGTKIIRDRNGIEREHVRTRYVEIPKPCKQCGKEPRKLGSSRCEKCSTPSVASKASNDRLQAKIESQIKSETKTQ